MWCVWIVFYGQLSGCKSCPGIYIKCSPHSTSIPPALNEAREINFCSAEGRQRIRKRACMGNFPRLVDCLMLVKGKKGTSMSGRRSFYWCTRWDVNSMSHAKAVALREQVNACNAAVKCICIPKCSTPTVQLCAGLGCCAECRKCSNTFRLLNFAIRAQLGKIFWQPPPRHGWKVWRFDSTGFSDFPANNR